MEKVTEKKNLLYALFSGVSFVYLYLPAKAGVSVPIFALLQFAGLFIVIPDRKRLWLMGLVLILTLNSFYSAFRIYGFFNFFICVIIYCLMFIDFDINDTSLRFLGNIIKKVFEPLKFMHLPFALVFRANKENSALIKRLLLALVIALPSVLFLTLIMTTADMVFSSAAVDFFKGLFAIIRFETLYKIFAGLAVGLYLYGLLHSASIKKEASTIGEAPKGDIIIFSVLLISVLLLYTVFVILQFRYLFAGAQLPNGLSYTEYARKGFFEQLFLTGLNIILILLTVSFNRDKQGGKAKLIKSLCCYLCLVTVILLVSSFYRMYLYYVDDGLTRMRFLVFGFLIFEFIGLLITFFYIIKPKFNMVAVYLMIGFAYYIVLNIVPMDYFVAKSQVDRYIKGEYGGLHYALSLSADAVPQLDRLLSYDKTYDIDKYFIKLYLADGHKSNLKFNGWRQYNLSDGMLEQIYNKYT